MPDQPTDEALRALARQLEAGDRAGLQSRSLQGDLDWLEPRLGADRFLRFKEALRAGDLSTARRSIEDAGLWPALIATTVTAADPTLLVSRGGAVLPAEAVRRERNTLYAIGVVVALLVVGLIAWLVLRNRNDDSTVAPSTTTSVVETSIVALVPDSVAVITTTSAPTGVAATAASVPAAATTTSVSPTVAAAVTAPANAATAPVDVITVAGRSATFAPFLAMVEAAGLTNELRTAKPLTVLAPTESAFASLPADFQVALRSPANRVTLARIVRYNLIPQTIALNQFVTSALKTVEGSPVAIQATNGSVKINEAKVTGGDIRTTGGVLHSIDKLLVPPGVDLNTLVPKSAIPAPNPPQTRAAAATTAPAPVATLAPAITTAATAAPTTESATQATAATTSPRPTTSATAPTTTAPATTTTAPVVTTTGPTSTTAAPTTRAGSAPTTVI